MNWGEVGYTVSRVVIAYVLALPIGWDREREARSMGVRTFPLTAMASCAYVLLAGGAAEAQSRVIQGLLAGIGFLGAGAILKGRGSIHGTATAASIFNTGVIGAAVALNRLEIAVVLAILNLVTLRLLLPLKRRINPGAAEREEQEDRED